MGYNYKKATDEMLKKLAMWRVICLEDGMSEEDTEDFITEMKDFEIKVINMNRKYERHKASYSQYTFSDDKKATEEHSPLLKDYAEQLSCTQVEIIEWNRYAWIDDIDNPDMTDFVLTLSDTEIELLTLKIIDGMTQKEIALLQKRSDAAVSKQKANIKKKMKKWLASRAGYSTESAEIRIIENLSGLHKFAEAGKSKK